MRMVGVSMKALQNRWSGPGSGMSLWASEHRYRRLFESSKDGILILDAGNGRIVDVNPTLEAFLECAGDKLIGREVWKVPAFRPVVDSREALADWVAQEILRFEEVSLQKTDGTHLDLEIVGNVYQGAGQRVVQWNIRDITARKLAEKTIVGLNVDLEQRVRERTAELAVANQELKKAIEVADTANRAKSDFLASMSHEIRTPLNAIIGFCDLAMQSDCHPRSREYLAKIQKAGVVLLGILNDILDISKVEKGLLELEEIDFELDEVLHNVFSTVEVSAREKGLEILLEAPPDLPRHFRGDPLRLGQILVNLVGNAVKFTNQGEIVLVIAVLEKGTKNVRLGILVRDTGIGIPQVQLGRLFRPFSQADCSTTRKYGGTGLGLSICKKLVELHGGEILATSEPGRGTTFSLSVVLKTADHGTIERKAPYPVDAEAASRPPSGPVVGAHRRAPRRADPPATDIILGHRRPSRLRLGRPEPEFMDNLLELRKLLDRHDFNACRHLREMKDRFSQTWCIHPEFRFVEKWISNFHFEEAGNVLDTLIRKIQEARHEK